MAKPRFESLAPVITDFEGQFKDIVETSHPIDHLQTQLRAPQQKVGFAKAVIPMFQQVNPEFNQRITSTVDLARAADARMGQAGLTHALTLGVDVVPKTLMGVFWRGKPSAKKIWDWLVKSLHEGLDTTQKAIKICISPELCGADLKEKIFFTGYAGGSSVGVAQTLGLHMLLNAKGDASDVPEVKAWLKTLTEIKVTWVVYENSFDRVIDAFSSKSRASEIEDTHPMMFALAIKEAVKGMPLGFQLTKAFLQEKLMPTMKELLDHQRLAAAKRRLLR